ncbi:hypothetical protein LCGC14_0903760 [marine sediment metagenome]|uniref:Imm-5-like domain-containing protein n=1 Tax=marine sediment metagenome TaxID=412755 RepID=A0A0F9REP6_9ZZZZ
MKEIYTTGEELQKHRIPNDIFEHLTTNVPDYNPASKISMLQIIEISGLDVAIWALRAIIGKKKKRKIALEFTIACAEHVLPNFENLYTNDNRPRKAIEAARLVLISDTKKNRELAYRAYMPAHAALFVGNSSGDARIRAAASAASISASYLAHAAGTADATISVGLSDEAALYAAISASQLEAVKGVQIRPSPVRKWQKQKLIDILKGEKK